MNIVDTNIVYADIVPEKAKEMHTHLLNNNLKVNFPEKIILNGKIRSRFRFVVHLDIDDEDIIKLINICNNF